MNYELARELKEAGFPRNIHEGLGELLYPYPSDGQGTSTRGTELKMSDFGGLSDELYIDGSAYAPTLSELIEACGDEFGALAKLEEWRAVSRKDLDNPVNIGVVGSTPEEAVAKLWLALNRK